MRLTQNMHHVSARKKKVHQRILQTKQKSCFNTRTEAPTLYRFSKNVTTELATLYNIKQNTVSNILKNKDKWLLVNPDLEEANKQREKNVHFPQVEETLSLWITNALSANLIISGDTLHKKAKFFAQQFEITRFSASNKWVDKFKKCHNLKKYIK